MTLTVVGGCILDRTGTIEQTCSIDEDCDDGTPCTSDVCKPEGLCEHTAIDATGEVIQIPHDCKTLRCDKGRAVEVPDDGDVPSHPCTNASCTDGVLAESPKTDGTSCSLGDGEGTCVGGECQIECDPAMPPTDPNWPCGDPTTDPLGCTTDYCDAAVRRCLHDPLDNVPAPLGNAPGDCRVTLCVQGVAQEIGDNNDLPDDGNECTYNECSNGMTSFPPVPKDTPCGTNLEQQCNGDETTPLCVGCTGDEDCPDAGGDCIDVFCLNPGQATAACTTQFENPGTGCNDTNACTQTDNCDSAGSCIGSNPVVCTPLDQCHVAGTCNGGNCSNPNKPNGDPCSDGQFCSANDTCQGGSCSPGGTTPCSGHNVGPNCNDSCNESADNCTGSDQNGIGCTDGLFCTANTTCNGGGSCGGGNNPCPGHNVGPNCNDSCSESADNCSGSDNGGTSCNDSLFCNGADTCNGSGSCSHAGDPCPGPDNDIDCTETCNEAGDACNGYDGDGAACDDGTGGNEFCGDMSMGCNVGVPCASETCS